MRRVILPQQPSPAWDGQSIAAQALQADYHLAAQVQAAGWPVQVYVRPPEELPARAEEFAGGLQLSGASVEPAMVVPGGIIAVHLRWDGAHRSLPAGEKVTVQLLNEGNQVVAQTDRPFPSGQVTPAIASYGIALPRSLPAGSYRLIVALYDPDKAGARLPTAAGVDSVELAALEDLTTRPLP